MKQNFHPQNPQICADQCPPVLHLRNLRNLWIQILLLCLICASSGAAQQKASPGHNPQAASLALTELERLKYENLETRMQLFGLRQEKLVRDWEQLRHQQQELEAAIPALLREILKAHGHPDGSIDLKSYRVIPKAETTKTPEENNP